MISESPLVSVVIPAYNCESYIQETVNSALSQDGANVEVVVIDDGSSDGTGAVLDALAAAAPKLRVIHQENRGVSAARNAGIEQARGEYVIFLDSDDLLAPNCVCFCLDLARARNLDIVLYSAEAFCDGMPEELLRNFRYSRSETQAVPARTFLRQAIEDDEYTVQPCLYMMRRSTIGALRFPVGQIHEDNVFTTALLLQDACVSASSRVLYRRRLRPNSIMTQPRTERHVDGLLKAANALAAFSAALGIDVGLGRALNKVIGQLLVEAVHSQRAFKGFLPWSFRAACARVVRTCPTRQLRPKTLLAGLVPEVFDILSRLKKAAG